MSPLVHSHDFCPNCNPGEQKLVDGLSDDLFNLLNGTFEPKRELELYTVIKCDGGTFADRLVEGSLRVEVFIDGKPGEWDSRVGEVSEDFPVSVDGVDARTDPERYKALVMFDVAEMLRGMPRWNWMRANPVTIPAEA